jgi:hypothetical protein
LGELLRGGAGNITIPRSLFAHSQILCFEFDSFFCATRQNSDKDSHPALNSQQNSSKYPKLANSNAENTENHQIQTEQKFNGS